MSYSSKEATVFLLCSYVLLREPRPLQEVKLGYPGLRRHLGSWRLRGVQGKPSFRGGGSGYKVPAEGFGYHLFIKIGASGSPCFLWKAERSHPGGPPKEIRAI